MFQLGSFTYNLSILSTTDWNVVQWTVPEYCAEASIELSIRVTSFTAHDLAKMISGFMMLHFHPGKSCLQRVIDHAIDILLGEGILQEQSEAYFLTVEQWLKIRDFKAHAELDDIHDPQRYRNRRKVKGLKRIITGSADREHPDHQKQIFDNFTGAELAAFMFSLAQLNVPKQTEKLFDYTKEEVMRDAVQLNVRQSRCCIICLKSHFCRNLSFPISCGQQQSMDN